MNYIEYQIENSTIQSHYRSLLIKAYPLHDIDVFIQVSARRNPGNVNMTVDISYSTTDCFNLNPVFVVHGVTGVKHCPTPQAAVSVNSLQAYQLRNSVVKH